MRTHTLKRVQRFHHPVREVFAFFETPENLAVITPPWLDFTILTPGPISMRQGAVIDYTIRWLTIPVRWTSLISVYMPPVRFVDEQIRGPYRLWRHTHSFAESDGWTTMTDEVEYRVPYGIAGTIAHALVLRHQLEEIFHYRAETIGRVFGVAGGEARGR